MIHESRMLRPRVERMSMLDPRRLAVKLAGPHAILRCSVCRAWWTVSGDLERGLAVGCPVCGGQTAPVRGEGC